MASTSPIFTFAIRGTQALFAIVVFGLSTTLIKGHKFGSLPSTLGFVAFVGGISFVTALLGIASHWVKILQGKAGMLIDVVIAGLNVAGGVVSPPHWDSRNYRLIDYSCWPSNSKVFSALQRIAN